MNRYTTAPRLTFLERLPRVVGSASNPGLQLYNRCYVAVRQGQTSNKTSRRRADHVQPAIRSSVSQLTEITLPVRQGRIILRDGS